MTSLKEKIYDWRNRLRDRHMLSLVVTLVTIITVLGLYTYKREINFRQMTENDYNMAFFELVNYVENVETYLAKSLISSTPQHAAETLTQVWRESNLAQAYLSRLPIGANELANTSKFLNQVSDYSFSLSRKNINNEGLTEEDFNNLKQLHTYSVELENTLNQLSTDINDGRIKWGELTNKGTSVLVSQVSNISQDSFSNLEENFHEYSGLIYDGAFSEHMTSVEKKGLTGNDISEEEAKEIAINYIGNEKIEKIESNGLSENTDIPCYYFNIKIINKDEKNNNLTIAITKKGGHIYIMNYTRNVEFEAISQERANEIGKEFLEAHGFANMKETYFLKQNGIVTINYAYNQQTPYGNVVVYSDLVKVKIALDNGEVLGIETTGYLNSHTERNIEKPKITLEQAKENLNKSLNIESEGLAIIPTEFKTEIFCYEFKGNVEGIDFIVYINAETGKEEDILVIRDTPNGTLTM